MTKPLRRVSPGKMSVIGWREIVSLPDFGIAALRAKVDTGARTSALHAVDLEVFDNDDGPRIGFHVPLPGNPRWRRCVARIVDHRQIKNTGGVPEHRYVVETTLVMGRRHWRIEVSLADREQMEFDLLLGRTAIRGRRLLIDPGRSFLAGPPDDRRVKQRLAPETGLLRTLGRGTSKAHDAPNQGDEH